MGDDNTRGLLVAVAAFLIGLLIGWLLLGWVIFPVSYTNAYLRDLRPEHQELYLRAVAEAYELNGDPNLARQRLQALGSREAVAQLAAGVVQRAEANGDLATANRMRSLLFAVGLPLPTAEAQAVPAVPSGEGGGNRLLTVCGGIAGLLVILAGIVLVVYLLRGRSAEETPPTVEPGELPVAVEPVQPIDWETEQKATAPAAPTLTAAPVLQEHAATYNIGDTSYDESFDVEDPVSGVYLGEYGMTISEVVNGDPNRVTALEVWLFDKSDIRTVTKVLMSDYAYGNQALRDKLAARGDAILAQPGTGFVLDAQTLRLEGEITALEYAEDQGPAHSAFRRVSVNLRVLQQT